MADISKITPPGSSTVLDIKDAQARSDLAGKISDNPTFSEASTRANIASGESISTLFGKIKKYFTDLASVAFSGSYNDLSNKPTIPVKALWVNMGTLSSLPVTKTVSGCQTDMVCAKAELGTPSAQTGNWTINTDTEGKVTVSGTISGSTTVKLLLVQETSVTAS